MVTPFSDHVAAEPPSQRLRVASIYRSFNTAGSIEALYLRNAERLAQDEDVTVFTSAAGRAATTASLSFVPIEPAVRGRGRWRYALECSTFARRASRAVARRRAEFDVVHVEGFAAYAADLVTVHAVRAAEIEHYFTRVEAGAGVVRHRLGSLVRPQAGVVMRAERRLFQRPFAPYCICPSKGVKRDLERWHGVPSDRIKVLPYGVELERFRRDPDAGARLRAELGTPPDRLVLLFVGSGFERKGLDVAIEGLARSGAAGPELWVIGGSDADRLRVERASQGLGGRVRLLGTRAPADLPAFYSAADIFVLPTRQDSWAIPVTEALAAGCVVVTSEYAGSCDLITHGVDGYVLRGGGSGEELAALLAGPLADPGTRAAVAARGRKAIAPHDYESFYAEYRASHRFAYELARERLGARRHGAASRAATCGSAAVIAAGRQGLDR
jgi:glycosyltransferase involved in cell wall biosynthesis